MKIVKIVFAAFIMMNVWSCSPSLTPFTQKIYDQNNWSEQDLKKIQFYLSDDIVLYRDVTEGSSNIESGTVRIKQGRKIQEVIIREGTPGVLLFSPKDDRFAISFEDGNDERFLMFGPNPKASNRYVLLAKEWKRKKGKVTYEGINYFTNAESAYAALMIDLRQIKRTSVKKRTASGRTL